jgi:hypothetical protein
MSKKTFNKPRRIQSIYFILIFISGGGLFYIKTLPDEQQNLLLMLLLLLGLLYGLMKSTRNWAYDNPKPKEGEGEDEQLKYKERDIPGLEEMIKNIKDKKEK